ncbi:PREDICTED: dual specificity protein phosphatase 19 [Nicrophorus vespilloides]|uniref:Dual specificity protein phosphatase 19 n=1 Tax=Nicrophorus vespilloides TaxID=110193 RepID=A0ABM1MWL3_NICVS|nr:PREDICTED: dual specificity protein phosphatase 19 [Nicrophorus vespilloides]
MSFLDQILRKRLKRTRTVVTQLDGSRTLVSSEGGEPEVRLSPATSGYVVDRSPDAIPARVLDNLFVGSQDCCDPDTLIRFGIIAVLSVGVEAPVHAPEGVTYKFMECLDLPDTSLPELLHECSLFIEAESKVGGVLVHCNAGVSRSVTIVVGYLITRLGYDFATAMALVRAARPSAKPNVGFDRQLRLL